MSAFWNRKLNLPLSAVCVSTALAFVPGCGTADTGAQQEAVQERAAINPELDAISRDHLRRSVGQADIGPDDDLRVTRQFGDDAGYSHTRYQQTINGVPVFGGEAIVHVGQDRSLQTVSDTLQRNLQIDTATAVPMRDAIRLALAEYGCSDCLTQQPKADLWVLRHEGKDHLAYRVQLRREDGSDKTALPVLFVDAHTGEVVWKYNNLQTVAGTGSSLYSGTVTVETTLFNGLYYLEENTTVSGDAIRRIGTFDARNTTSAVYRLSDADNIWNSATQRAGVDAHYGARATWDYYWQVHGRRGIDNNNGPGLYPWVAGSTTLLISSIVHYGVNYANAFWNGSRMTYGDGNGTTFGPLVTLDIAGHEITHGVTERTAGLIYSGQSGALNESMSDVFGAMVERWIRGIAPNTATWQIGEQAYTPATPGDALRHMNSPHLAANAGFTADDDPDHYAERYTGTGDNGGVHINSGIPNHVFYLCSQGGTHHRSGVTVTGIGYNACERIWYRALTGYMTSSTNFAGARSATLSAAAALYGSGSAQYNTVAQAWTACGI
jgi:Zn-dependent metalloprotease